MINARSLASTQAESNPMVENHFLHELDNLGITDGGKYQDYESALGTLRTALLQAKFKTELAAIENWFKVLTETERTASVCTLLQHSTSNQIQMFKAIISELERKDNHQPLAIPSELNGSMKAKSRPKQNPRPPSLNIPFPDSPVPSVLVSAPQDKTSSAPKHVLGQSSKMRPEAPEFRPSVDTPFTTSPAPLLSGLPGFGRVNTETLNMIANAGLSPDAQLLAVKLVLNGTIEPISSSQPATQPKPKKSAPKNLWPTPVTGSETRFPKSALRSNHLISSTLGTGGSNGSVFGSASSSMSTDSPREEDFDPSMLQDIPTWMKCLRLHKYTNSFDGMTWQEIIVLDDAALESKGVIALGARRRLLRTFEFVRKRMGIEDPSSATPTTSTIVKIDGAPQTADEHNGTEPQVIDPLDHIPQSAVHDIDPCKSCNPIVHQ